MNLNDETRNILARRREQELEAIMEEEVVEEANSIPEVQDAIEEVVEDETDSIAEEEITDHQAVADVLSNGEIYDNLTEDRLRQVVEDVLGEADEEVVQEMAQAERILDAADTARVSQIDLSQIPPGMDTETFVRHFQTTGSYTLTTNSTTDVNWVDAGTTDAVQPRLDLTQPAVATIQAEAEAEIEEIPPTPEEIARIKRDRLIYHKQQLKYKRDLHVSDMHITKDDLIITFSNGSHTFYHIDIEGEHSVQGIYKPYNANKRMRGSNSNIGLSCEFIFDKNMNRLIVDKGSADKSIRTRRDGRRIYASQVPSSSNSSRTEIAFVVINKNAFLNSKGRVWRIRRRERISYQRIKETKNMYKDQFDRIEQFLGWMKFNIEQIHSAEDYDIMYNFGGFEHHLTSDFNILLKFNNVTISNSIELEHYIGDFVVKSQGTHYFHNGRASENRSILRSSIYGTRLTFTPEDASKNYQHSHLTTSMFNFGCFCTGDQRYGTDEGYIDEYTLQEHIFRMQSFLSWESLEGGPHNKIENINAHGAIARIEKNIVGVGRQVGDTYVERLIYEINQTPEKFNSFASCFTIINQNGVLRFVADYQMFFQKFMEIIDNDLVKRIHGETGERFYTYNKEMGTFHRVNDLESVIPELLIKKAQKNMRSFTSIYINGRYHTPRLTTRETGAMFEALRFSPEPNAMKEIAQYIMYLLTNKLEEHGNSSEST